MQVEALTEQVSILNVRVNELESQISKNSRNSSKPPSSDGYKKKPALPKTRKKTGGQKGHKGDTLKMVDHADETICLKPDQCVCGHPLKQVDFELIERRQLFDIPPPQLHITEYQSFQCDCPKCGEQLYQPFPSAIKAPVQYGSGVKTLCTLLSTKYHLSYDRISQLFVDLFGQPINDSTQLNICQRAYEVVASPMEQIKQAILDSPIAHSDETGLRVGGKLQWLHNLSTDLYTYIFCHEKRGSKAIFSTVSILPSFNGILIHDCYSSYFKLLGCQHALCGAHLLRELQGLIESGSVWAENMQNLLLTLYKKANDGWTLTSKHRYWRRYDSICDQAEKEEPPPIKRARGKPKNTKGRNLLNRLIKYKSAVLLFATDPTVPFTNNQAERDVRPAKIKQKNAGCFRTKKGADIYACIYSFLSTMRKLKRNIFNELFDLFEGQQFELKPLST